MRKWVLVPARWLARCGQCCYRRPQDRELRSVKVKPPRAVQPTPPASVEGSLQKGIAARVDQSGWAIGRSD